jgi:DNA-binding XRE family transcriptional regulator
MMGHAPNSEADMASSETNKALQFGRESAQENTPNISLNSLEDYLRSLGRRVQERRKAAHYTQQQLADASAIDRTFISALENGKQNVSVGALLKIANALKIPLEILLAGEQVDA